MKRSSLLVLSLILVLGLPLLVQAQEATPTGTPGVAPNQQGGSLHIGDTVQGALSISAPTATYTFSGQVGQAITITQHSSEFDSYLILEDASGATLTSDDDIGGNNLDSRIGPYMLPTTGTYIIVAESYDYESNNGTGVGSFTLSLTAATIQNIEYTQAVNANMTASEPTAAYSFRGQAGDAVVIAMTSDAFDTYLTLYQTGNPNELTYSDDSGSGTNSLIGPFVLPSTGDYQVIAGSYDGTGAGPYTLTLNKATIISVAYGQTVQAGITATDGQNYFSFQGTAGDVVNISVQSNGAIDTSMILTAPDGTQVATDDDSGSGLDPELMRQILTQTGTYTIGIAPYSPGDTGQFSLSLQQGRVASLDETSQRLTTGQKSSTDEVSFTGVAGQRVHLTLTLVDGISASPSLTITQNGNTIAYPSGSSISGLTTDFTVPENGTVLIAISETSGSKLTFEVSIH